ncbi:hypothetical protein CEW89_17865 [Celeribacter ethanolicus]|uniref:Uncharacterized protein n=1 Tax=Celeribacter ethanolicus TaxID=1758178 RepID=A0A291GGG7_9RHOB|nr:hypothetical protein [Celeribacter ethanolicus]ATG49277.1 hypothetical protein CEW89_17865 [Celeribacter ethanolicus]
MLSIEKQLSAITMAVILIANPATTIAAENSWHCDGATNIDDDEIKARAPNRAMVRVLQEYRDRWDAQHMRAQCEAFVKGEPHEISCLNGRRNWDEIEAMVPEEVWELPRSAVRPIYLALQEEDSGASAALAYCRDVGAIE